MSLFSPFFLRQGKGIVRLFGRQEGDKSMELIGQLPLAFREELAIQALNSDRNRRID